MRYPAFVRENPPLALFALLAMATSGFGQTFFISVFGAGIRDSFSLTNSTYGLYYGLATLTSAALLLKLGALADRWPLWRITLLAVGLLTCGCLLMGLAPHWSLLIPGFLLVRLGGQGLLTHLGMTVAGRYFVKNRGRITALAAGGLPLAEATLPAGAGLLLVWGGWRLPWFVAVGVLLLLALPALMRLSRTAAHPDAFSAQETAETQTSRTREQALRDPGFYLLLPAALAVPFTVTAVFFHQTAIAESRGWLPEDVALAFTGFALGHFLSLFVGGPMVDRLGAQRSLPLSLIPIFSGLLVLAMSDSDWTLYLYLGLTGLTLGMSGAAANTLWPERYGVRHIGAIRSVAQAAMVLSTALSPLIVGFMLDADLSAAVVALSLAVFVAVGAALTFLVKAPR